MIIAFININIDYLFFFDLIDDYDCDSFSIFEFKIDVSWTFSLWSKFKISSIFKNENRKTSLWIHEHTSRIQRHSASTHDAVNKSKALHIFARCTRNRFIVLQYTKLRSLLSSSKTFDFCKYNSNRAIFDVDYQIWSESFLKFFQKLRF
jgi:hypothetical protein